VLATLRFAVLTPDESEHLIDGACTTGKTYVARGKCLKTVMTADETRLDADSLLARGDTAFRESGEFVVFCPVTL